MARDYKPMMPFDVAMKLLTPIETKVKGVTKKTFTAPEDSPLFKGSFKTYGGTENFSNDVYTVFDTAIIDTWYNPNITNECRIYICETGKVYEIKSPPENIGMRHQYMQIRVEAVGGKP